MLQVSAPHPVLPAVGAVLIQTVVPAQVQPMPQTGIIQPLPQCYPSAPVRPPAQPQTFQMTNSVPPSVPQPGYNAGLMQGAAVPVQPVLPPAPSRASVSSMSPGSLPPSLPGSVHQSAAPSIASSTPRQSIDKGLSDMS